MQSASSYSDDSNTKTSVHECIIQVATFILWHTAIFTGLTVEDQVDGKKSTSKDGATIEKTLAKITLGNWIVCAIAGLEAAEGLLEGSLCGGAE